MYGGTKMRLGAMSALAAAGLFATVGGASAADLGGDCCADLEERVAELEATTVRKGNRKVSLTITGWVSEGIMWWDDGTESNVYQVHDSTDLASNVIFTGSANITSDASAGYLMQVMFDHANAIFVNQDNDDANFGVTIQQSYWFMKSKQYGKVSVGKMQAAADNAVILTDFTGTLFQHNAVTFEGVSMALTPSGGTRPANNPLGFLVGVGPNPSLGTLLVCNTLRQGIGNDCAGERTNAIRYDTPTFAGFSASTSFGEDDVWDLTGRWAGEFGGFKLSFATAYSWVNGDGQVATGIRRDINNQTIDVEHWQIGGTIKHLASNLWFHGYYTDQDVSSENQPAFLEDGESFYLKAGWSPKLNPLGTTHFVGEYRENHDTFGSAFQQGSGFACGAWGASGGNIGAACGGGANAAIDVTGSEVTAWGVGLVQEIDAASMNLWIKYRHYESEIDFIDRGTGAGGTQDFNDIDLVFGGAHIFF